MSRRSRGAVQSTDFGFQGNVQSTQEIVELILDTNRNSLLALDLKVLSSLCRGVFSGH